MHTKEKDYYAVTCQGDLMNFEPLIEFINEEYGGDLKELTRHLDACTVHLLESIDVEADIKTKPVLTHLIELFASLKQMRE